MITEIFIVVQLMLPDNIQPSWLYIISALLFDLLIQFMKYNNEKKSS